MRSRDMGFKLWTVSWCCAARPLGILTQWTGDHFSSGVYSLLKSCFSVDWDACCCEAEAQEGRYHGISETISFLLQNLSCIHFSMVFSLGLSNRADHTGNILCLAECGQCGVRVSSHISLPRHLKQISDTRSQYVFVSFSLSKNKSFCLPTVKYTAKQKPQRTRVVDPVESFMD